MLIPSNDFLLDKSYPSRSLVYNAVDSGLAAAECTLRE